MTSYRTLVFGAIAMVCATSPAWADSATAKPGPVQFDSATAKPKHSDSVSAKPGPQQFDSATAKPGPVQFDSATAKPKFLVLAGVPGIAPMTLDVSWLLRIIDR